MQKPPGARLKNKAAARTAAQETNSVYETVAALFVVISAHGDGDATERLTSLCRYDGSVLHVTKHLLPDVNIRRRGRAEVISRIPAMAALEPALKGFKVPSEPPFALSSAASKRVQEMVEAIPSEEDLHERWLSSAKVKKFSLELRT